MVRALPLVAVCFALGAMACTEQANVGTLGSGVALDGGGGRGDGDADAADTTDAGDVASDGAAPRPLACGIAFADEGSFVLVGTVTGPTPTYGGGSVVPGTYALVSVRAFVGTGTAEVRETILLEGGPTTGTLRRIREVRGATGSFRDLARQGTSSSWELGYAASFDETPACPDPGALHFGRYETKPDTLTIFDDIELIERTYRFVR